MTDGEYVESLVNEYTVLFDKRLSTGLDERDEKSLVQELTIAADWSPSGARELIKLVDNYGAFILRNALAIAIVLGKEDGSQGF